MSKGAEAVALEQSAAPTAAEAARQVLFIAPQPFFAHRGSPFRVRATVSALASLGYSVDLLVLPFGEEVTLPGVRILRSAALPGVRGVPIGPSWTKFFLDIGVAARAFALMRQRRYAAVHGVEEGGVIAAILARIFRVPYVFDMHSCLSDQLHYSGWLRFKPVLDLIRTVEAWCIKGASAVMTVGSDLTDRAQIIAPHVPGYSLEDLPLVDELPSDPTLVDRLAASLGLKNRRVILYTGNFEGDQGIELLLRAFARTVSLLDGEAAASAERPCLVLVGGGEGYRPEACRFQALARELRIAEDVVFAGQRPVEEMGSFLALAEIVVSPRTEGTNTPLKVYSYMAARRLIVATRIKSHTQVLDDGCAVLAEPEPERLGEALLAALDRSELAVSRRASRIAKARQLVDTRFNLGEFGRKLREMYNVLAAESS